ncbi:MAG TPA: TrbI/VirB10 family protein [Candidatus Saccharimonadales bacterium]|nr:TrbI/VirB10 family protein [Candidatus Saccharimonadales bacterium]
MSEERKTLPTDTGEPLASRTPEVRDRRPLPEGVVSKQSQAYLIVGLSVLILLAVMFSNNRTKPVAKPSAAFPAIVSTDANQRSIEELKRDLAEEQRKSAEQAQSQKSASSGPSSSTSGGAQTGTTPGNNMPAHVEPPRDPVKDAERALIFKARFASNLVSVSDGAAHPVATQSEGVTTTIPAQIGRAAQASATASKHAPEVNINSAFGQPYVLFEGTTVDTALVNRLDGEFSGPVKVMVTNPIYSQDRQHVLIPEGTFILGEVQKVSGFGQKRLAVVFHRMLMPDGYSVDLDQFHGLDQVGETGLRDKVNNHYLEIFGASIALGVISGAAEATSNGGYNQSGSDMYRQGVASSLSQESAHVLDRFINVPPTITIREGHRIKVYLTQDLLLPAYENHTVPPNI